MRPVETEAHYPGETATAWQIFDLANAYEQSAITLLKQREIGIDTESPARFCAIHAIELFLNAYLRSEGVAPQVIRKRMHDLSADDFCDALKLRRGTVAHLTALTQGREYLRARYAPDQAQNLSQITRLLATLGEVQQKTYDHLWARVGKAAD
ncbi:MAG: hypothetical protein AAF891_11260 [Pseudomonadota bacterium]